MKIFTIKVLRCHCIQSPFPRWITVTDYGDYGDMITDYGDSAFNYV